MINLFIFILDERAAKPSLEVDRRLDRVQKTTIDILRQKIVDDKKYSKMTLALMERMDKKREPHIWRALIPIVVEIISNKATIVPNEHGFDFENWEEGYPNPQKQLDPVLLEPLSKLLLSVFDKDSKELQAEAEKQIVFLTGEPLYEQGILISLYNLRLQNLSKLPENKLGEMEKGLKALRKLNLQIDSSRNPETNIAHAAKPHLKEMLRRNIEALATNDPEKQKIGASNIAALKAQFNFPQVKDLISSNNGALIFDKRQEFSRNLTNVKDLQALIQVAQSISDLTRNDTNYHKSYITWFNKQIDDPGLTKHTDREEIQNILESALIEELFTLYRSTTHGPLQKEIINPLIKTYTKLAKVSSLNADFSRRNLQALIDFQYFSQYSLQKMTHDDLLVLFDTVTDSINKLPAKDKASLRQEIVIAVPRYDGSFPKGHKDYIARLSNFYCDQKNIDTDEFMNLVTSLFNSPDSEHVGNHLPPEIMLGFIEGNPKYFEKNIQHLIETCKKSKVQAEVDLSVKRIQRIYSSFQRLFDEGHKTANNRVGWLTQYYPGTRLANISNSGSINLQYRRDLQEQISRIKNWFNQRLEKEVKKTILLDAK